MDKWYLEAVLTAALFLGGAALAPSAQAQTKVWSTDLQLPSSPPPTEQPAPGQTKQWSNDFELPAPPPAPPPEPEPARDEPAPVYTFKPGDSVTVNSPGSGMWYPGTVDKVRDGQYFIKYSGLIAPSDAWVEARWIRPVGGSSSAGKPRPAQKSWKSGDVVEVSSKGTWYLASILEVSGGRYKIHYARYDSSWDEWVGPERIRAAPPGARTSQPQPTGRFVCQVFEENQLKPQGEFILKEGGTYRDVWNKKSGTWKFDAATRALRFTGVLDNGGKASYDPEHRHGMITFDWGGGVKRHCYR